MTARSPRRPGMWRPARERWGACVRSGRHPRRQYRRLSLGRRAHADNKQRAAARVERPLSVVGMARSRRCHRPVCDRFASAVLLLARPPTVACQPSYRPTPWADFPRTTRRPLQRLAGACSCCPIPARETATSPITRRKVRRPAATVLHQPPLHNELCSRGITRGQIETLRANRAKRTAGRVTSDRLVAGRAGCS